MERQLEREELRSAAESLPHIGDSVVLEDRDALALLGDVREKLPQLKDELKTQSERVLSEIEAELEMSEGDEVVINEKILRGIVKLAINVGAAQAIYDTGAAIHEIHDLREHYAL